MPSLFGVPLSLSCPPADKALAQFLAIEYLYFSNTDSQIAPYYPAFYTKPITSVTI